MSSIFDMLDTEEDDIENSSAITEVNKYDPLVAHIDNLSVEELKVIREMGYLDETISDEWVKIALQYFITIISEETGNLSFEYKKAIAAYNSSAYLDKTFADSIVDIINQGTIRALFSTATFNRKRELEREIEKVEIMNSMIYDLTEMGGDKDQLALLKTMVNIAKDNENKLRDTRDFVLLHIPEEEFVDSYLLLLNTLNDIMPEYARVNSINSESIKNDIKKDTFVKRENVLEIEKLENLMN